jgi:AmmeMemoRadiSam system protein A
MNKNLSHDDKLKLLTYVRKIIEKSLFPERNIEIDLTEYTNPVFNENRGAFVTLHLDGNLRGCIGYVYAIKPLLETLTDVAKSAAFSDPRFMPLSQEEFDDIDLEVSVLSPITEVGNLDEIEVGKHGLIIKSGMSSGLLLPQVPVEQKWDKTSFLQHTCLKAGLPSNAYIQGANLFKFTATVFGEKGI